MTYQETIDWLFVQLPMYQRQGKSAYKPNLDNTYKLANYLGNPESKFRSIHVAGTNGKGSTSHMLAAILQEAGYKVGLYTSPHLKDFRERIKIDGKLVSKQFVIQFIKKNKAFFKAEKLSFFEMTVGMAFEYFAKKKVDVAIVEVGLGGRLDATNILTPEISVITNIGVDHTQFLGNTLESIAAEKAGIIKENVPVVVSEFQKETFPVFKKIAEEKNATILLAEELVKDTFQTDLLGNYQKKNSKAATLAIQSLKTLKVSETQLKAGLKKVVHHTGLLGRWQILRKDPMVICDTAHNREGLSIVMEQLSKENFEQLHIVFGVVSDKDLNTIIDILPQKAIYYLCKPAISRAMEVAVLEKAFKTKGFRYRAYDTVKEAYDIAFSKATSKDVIYVGGSTFVVAEIV